MSRQALIYWLVFIIVAIYAFTYTGTPAPSTDPVYERIREHLEYLTEKPRPIGSEHHAAGRDYLVGEIERMGHTPEVQTVMVMRGRGNYRFAAMITNVMVRIKGENPQAVMITAHYDSVNNAPGAGDDTLAVAAMVEAIRSITEPPKNDLIFLFSDAEEIGLMGARGFTEDHPWADDVKMVVNFECRGNSGASMLFETSPKNRELIRHFAQAVPNPVGTSLGYEVYRLMPNSTDFTVYKGAGIQGINLAAIGGGNHYHLAIDDLEALWPSLLRHQSDYVLGMAQYVATQGLTLNDDQGDAVFFNVPPLGFVHYSAVLTLPLALLVVALFIAVAVIATKRRQLRPLGVLLGLGLMVVSHVLAAVLTNLIWLAVAPLIPYLGGHYIGHPHHEILFFTALVLMAFGFFLGFIRLARRFCEWESLQAGGLLYGVLLSFVLSLTFPGGAYLLTWPMLIALVLRLIAFFVDQRDLLDNLGALPALLFIAPVTFTFYLAMPANLCVIAVSVALFPLIFAVGPLNRDDQRLFHLMAPALLVLGLLGMAEGVRRHQYQDARKPIRNSLFYAFDNDTGEALWLSTDRQMDPWTEQWFPEGSERGRNDLFFPATSMQMFQAKAEAYREPSPLVTVVDDQLIDGQRHLSFNIRSQRGAPLLRLHPREQTWTDVMVNGQEMKPGFKTFQMSGLPDEGILFDLVVAEGERVVFDVVDLTRGLPPAAQTRPDNMIPSSYRTFLQDTWLVKKRFEF